MPRNNNERRSHPRIRVPYPATVRGRDTAGAKFEEMTNLTDLSKGGAAVQLGRPVAAGEDVSIVIRLSVAPQEDMPVVSVAAQGTVVRADLQHAGDCEVGIQFKQYRLV